MKLDIKSFIIGILTTVNLFLLMGFDDHDEENQNGRYQLEMNESGFIIVMDSTNGEFVKYKMGALEAVNEIDKNPNKLESSGFKVF